MIAAACCAGSAECNLKLPVPDGYWDPSGTSRGHLECMSERNRHPATDGRGGLRIKSGLNFYLGFLRVALPMGGVLEFFVRINLLLPAKKARFV